MKRETVALYYNYYIYGKLNALARNIFCLPVQTRKDRILFKSILGRYARKKVRVFEWGLGRSTIYYSLFLRSIKADFKWHAIDNSREWYQKVINLADQHMLLPEGIDQKGATFIHLAEFPAFWEFPTWDWGKRIVPDGVCGDEIIQYIKFPSKIVPGCGFDVIIIDGRYRRRCLLEAFPLLAKGGVVILHDAQRKHYHSALAEYSTGIFYNVGCLPGSKVEIQTWVGGNTNQ